MLWLAYFPSSTEGQKFGKACAGGWVTAEILALEERWQDGALRNLAGSIWSEKSEARLSLQALVSRVHGRALMQAGQPLGGPIVSEEPGTVWVGKGLRGPLMQSYHCTGRKLSGPSHPMAEAGPEPSM